MAGFFAFLSFAAGLAGCGAVVVGGRWMRVDARLKARIDGQPIGGGSGSGLWQPLRPPRMLAARGRDRAEIEKELRSAGYYDPRALDTFAALRLAAAVVAGALSMLACFLITGNPFDPLYPTIALPPLTFIGAKMVLKMHIADRERVLTNEFPFLLDLMLMMLESGISLDQCFRGIARDERVAVPNHARLIAMLVEDLDRGQDYQLAFDRWAQRVGLNGSRELAALFRQSLFQGMELVPALKEFIREFSQRRVLRAKEKIGSITVRMVVLMLVFFMPALFIVLAGPPLAAIIDTLGTPP